MLAETNSSGSRFAIQKLGYFLKFLLVYHLCSRLSIGLEYSDIFILQIVFKNIYLLTSLISSLIFPLYLK